MFERVLVPTDGSEAVMPAVETALDIAQQYGATLHVLYVVEPPPAVAGMLEGAPNLDGILEELAEEGQQAANEIASRAEAEDVETEIAVEKGKPREDILSYAESHDIDLIIMGTHGRTGVKRTLLGSVTEAVVRHADVPVLTVQREPSE